MALHFKNSIFIHTQFCYFVFICVITTVSKLLPPLMLRYWIFLLLQLFDWNRQLLHYSHTIISYSLKLLFDQFKPKRVFAHCVAHSKTFSINCGLKFSLQNYLPCSSIHHNRRAIFWCPYNSQVFVKILLYQELLPGFLIFYPQHFECQGIFHQLLILTNLLFFSSKPGTGSPNRRCSHIRNAIACLHPSNQATQLRQDCCSIKYYYIMDYYTLFNSFTCI